MCLCKYAGDSRVCGGELLFEVTEGGGHVFKQLVEVCPDLSFSIFHGVLQIETVINILAMHV